MSVGQIDLKKMDNKLNMNIANYLILYVINIITSITIMSFYDKNMRFIIPVVITISVMYFPILVLNYFLKTFNNIIYKNLLYLILGLLFYMVLIYFINGQLELKDILINDPSGFVTIYSFIFYIILYTVILSITK